MRRLARRLRRRTILRGLRPMPAPSVRRRTPTGRRSSSDVSATRAAGAEVSVRVRTVVPQMLRVVSYRSLGAEQLRHPERAVSRLPSREHRRHRRAAADSARRGHRIDRGRKGPVHDRRMRRFQERRGPVTRASVTVTAARAISGGGDPRELSSTLFGPSGAAGHPCHAQA